MSPNPHSSGNTTTTTTTATTSSYSSSSSLFTSPSPSVFTNGWQSVLHSSALLSDVVFIYSSGAGSDTNQLLGSANKSLLSEANIYERGVVIREMDLLAGAGRVVLGWHNQQHRHDGSSYMKQQGYLSGLAVDNDDDAKNILDKKQSSILVPSYGLTEFGPSLRRLREDSESVVVHTSVYGVEGDDLAITRDHQSVIQAARLANVPALASKNIQEAHDVAVIAHLIARNAGLPVLHAFDQDVAKSEVNSVKLTTAKQLTPLRTLHKRKKQVELDYFDSPLLAKSKIFHLMGNGGLDISFDQQQQQQQHSFEQFDPSHQHHHHQQQQQDRIQFNIYDTISTQDTVPRLFSPIHQLPKSTFSSASSATSSSPSPSPSAISGLPADHAIISTIESAMATASSVLGRSYHLVDYFGPRDASVVIIASGIGSSAQKLSQLEALKRLGLGVLLLRLIHPVPVRALLQQLPASATRLVIAEFINQPQASGPFSSTHLRSSLSTEIMAALRGLSTVANNTSILPQIVKANIFSSASTKPFSEFSAVSFALTVTATSVPDILFFDSSSPACIAQGTEQHHAFFSAAVSKPELQVVFWEKKQQQEASRLILEVAGRHCPHVVKRSVASNDVTATHMRLAGAPTATALCGPNSAKLVAVHDASPSFFAKYDPIDVLAPNGILLLNAADDSEDLSSGSLFPSAIKQALLNKKIRVFRIDAHNAAIASNTDKSDVLAVTFLALVGWTQVDAVKALGLRQVFLSNDTFAAASDEEDWISSAMPVETVFDNEEAEQQQQHDDPFGHRREKRNRRPGNSISLLRRACWSLVFPEAHATEQRLHSDENQMYQVKLAVRNRLTPLDYERNVFHLEFDIGESGLKYNIGDALAIAGENSEEQVLDFLNWYGINPNQLVTLPLPRYTNNKPNAIQIRTALQALVQSLDIFGRPSKSFYETMSNWATDATEAAQLKHLTTAAGAAELKARNEETLTHADLLREFPSAHPSWEELVKALPSIKMRLYSISSSMKVHPDRVHLLVVTHDWTTPSGKYRIGQCTRYLQSLPIGSNVTVTLKPSVMKLPKDAKQPVIMAGLGTGMAPFRAFIEEHSHRRLLDPEVGDMSLYFGSRNRQCEYLYGEELEAYHDNIYEDGQALLTHLRLAFSRDQPQKVYIQHLIKEDGARITEYLLNQNGHFYLCGPTWPVADIKDALVKSFIAAGAVQTPEQASELLEELKEQGRYVLEVY